jgi:parvulin-like peptidyl-prolyl isomerase
MFKFLRSKAKVFYWVIAVTFIAFIFLAWGMDAMGNRGSRGGGGRQGGNSLGSVNGVEITSPQYEQAIRNLEANMKNRNPNLEMNENQRAMLREQAWDQVVRSVLVDQELERLGLTVTDEEIIDIFKRNPPAEILQAYVDSTGLPNMNAYYADLNNPARDWSRMEEYVRYLVPRQKLESMLTAGVVVGEDEVRETFAQQFGRAVVEYMGVPFEAVKDSWEPTDADVQKFYAEHPGDFLRSAEAVGKVASWRRVASAADYDEVRKLASDVKNEIVTGQRTFADAAAVYSEDGTAQNGGDLGVFDRSRMARPFSDLAFNLPVGQVSDPVQTSAGFHLIEVLERIEENGVLTKVHARHILLKVTPGEETQSALYERANAFRGAVTAQTFLARAQADTSCNVLSPRPFSEGRDIPGLRESAAGSAFCFRAAAGQISSVLSNTDLVYVVLSEGVQPAGTQPLESAAGQIKLTLKEQRQREAARTRLQPFLARVQSGQPMAEVAAGAGLKHGVSDTLSINTNMADIGYSPAFTQLALQSPTGTLVPHVATSVGVFAFRVLWNPPLNQQQYQAIRDRIYVSLLMRKQQAALETWYDEKMKAATIKDLRDALLSGA